MRTNEPTFSKVAKSHMETGRKTIKKKPKCQ